MDQNHGWGSKITLVSLCFDTQDFFDGEERWQLLHVPGEPSINRQHTSEQLLVADIPHPCLLSLKTDRKQSRRGESLFDCRQAPEAAAEHCLANKNKTDTQSISGALSCRIYEKQMAQKKETASTQPMWIIFSLLLSCHPVILSLCNCR